MFHDREDKSRGIIMIVKNMRGGRKMVWFRVGFSTEDEGKYIFVNQILSYK
jgi:hypothetical protein